MFSLEPSYELGPSNWAKGVGLPLVGNELLARVFDWRGWRGFTSMDVAVHLREFPLKYLQKKLSRLRKKGLLTRVKLPRTVKGGYRRGTFNMYWVTPGGAKRAEWWRESNSQLGFEYLKVGRGDLGEVPRCYLAQSTAALIFNEPYRLKVRSRDPNCLAALLTCQNPRSMLGYMISDRDNPLLPLVATLKSEGTIPKQVIHDPGIFLAVAKHGYHCSDTQTLIGLLYRSARYWKRSAAYWKRKHKRASEDASSQVKVKDSTDNCSSRKDLCRLREEELDRVKSEWMRSLVENASLKRRLDNMHWLVSDNNLDIVRMLKDLDKFTDPDLIKFFIRTKLRLLGGFNILYSSHNSPFKSGVA